MHTLSSQSLCHAPEDYLLPIYHTGQVSYQVTVPLQCSFVLLLMAQVDVWRFPLLQCIMFVLDNYDFWSQCNEVSGYTNVMLSCVTAIL